MPIYRHGVGHLNLLKTIFEVPIYKPRILILPPKPKPSHKHTVQSLLAKTRTDSTTGCMTWRGSIHTTTGYPIITINHRRYYVHRLIAFYTQIKHHDWRMYLMSQRWCWVCHTCDNPPCINPLHLVIADANWNKLDSQAKGRSKLADRFVDRIPKVPGGLASLT